MNEYDMTGSCVSDDLLVSMGSVLGWEAPDALAHIARCETCLGRLEDLRKLQDSLAGGESVRPGFTDAVMIALEDVVPELESSDERTLWGVAVLNPILAAAATLSLILFAGAGAIPPGSALLVSVLAGLGVFVWNRLPRRLFRLFSLQATALE